MILVNPYSFGNKWDVARAKAINSLTTNGFLARMDKLFIPKGAFSQAKGLEDWKGGSSASINGSASWSQSHGFIGSLVAGSYIDSAFTPSTSGVNVTLNDCSYGCYITALPSVDNVSYFGKSGGTANQAIYLSHASTNSFDAKINSSAGGGTTTGLASTGLFVLSRTSSTSWGISKNGVSIYSDTDTSGGLSSSPIYICGERNELGDFVTKESDCKVGVWWAGGSFSLAEQITLKSIFDTYFADVA